MTNQAKPLELKPLIIFHWLEEVTWPGLTSVERGHLFLPWRGTEASGCLLNNRFRHRELMESPSQAAFTNRRGCYLSGFLWVPYHLKEDQKTCLLKDVYFGTRAM